MLAEAELYQLGAQRKLLASGWSKVTEKVEALMGFKSNQFRQVVLLPQGEFRRLLTANSAERQEIMQALFKTDFYRQIEETLKSKAQTIKKAYDELCQEETWILREAQAETADELAGRLTENAASRAETAAGLKTAAAALQEAQKSLAEGTHAKAKLSENAAAQQQLTEYEAKAPLVQEKQQELNRAKQAAAIMDIENMLKNLADACHTAKETAAKEEAALLHAKSAHAKAQEKLTLEEKKEPEREKAAAEIQRLQELSGRLEALTKAGALLALRKEAYQEAQRQQAAVLSKLEKVQAALQDKTVEGQQLMEAAVQQEALKVRCD
jgi:exonuclease SbcC